MGIFDRFPYSSTHEMNLDFMLGKATEIAESLQEIDTHKEQAEQAATNAAQSAASAAEQYQSAHGAAIRAEVAQGNAENAATSAGDAADRAEAASDLADEAAEQAQAAATNASTAAEGAIASATAAETRINNLAASLPTDFTDLNNKVNNIGTPYNKLLNGFEYYNFTNGKYLTLTGSTADYSGAKITDYIPVKKGTTITATMKCIINMSAAIAYYNASKNIVISKCIFQQTGSQGSIGTASGTVTIEEDGYIRIGKQISGSSDDTILIVEPYPINDLLNKNGYQWNGKNWMCFGTSITDNDFSNSLNNNNPTGTYSNHLARISGLVQNNQGLAGGTIGNGGPFNSSGNILTRILATDVSNADLITLEGFINDITAQRPMGEQGSHDTTTFWGAISTAIEYFLENSHALVVLISTSLGKPFAMPDQTHPNYGTTYRNTLGYSIADYNAEMGKIARYYSIPFIDAGSKAMINEFHPEYIIDQIHQSILGGEQYAETIWSELKNLQPIQVES